MVQSPPTPLAAARGLIIIPFIDCPEETHAAVHDALAQLDGGAELLLIDQGSRDPAWAERFVNPRIRLWRHSPPMASLAATWNAALDYAWSIGHTDAMIWNNDVRVAAQMYTLLRRIAVVHALWFTTPVNCAEGPDREAWNRPWVLTDGETNAPRVTLGGPDFSCFLIAQACHAKYRFDERFQPAYHEDGDYHRRMWLGSDGDKIAGVTLPYLHYGSRTIHRSHEAAAAFAPQFAACRARYVAKWGGEPHHERKLIPDSREDLDGVETPGGYLNMPVRMPKGYAAIRYPGQLGVITGIEAPEDPRG